MGNYLETSIMKRSLDIILGRYVIVRLLQQKSYRSPMLLRVKQVLVNPIYNDSYLSRLASLFHNYYHSIYNVQAKRSARCRNIQYDESIPRLQQIN